MGIDTAHHESSNGSGRVILSRVASALQVSKYLLVDVAEVLPLSQIIKIHFVNFVNDLPHQLAGLHVVVRVLKHIADDTSAVPLLACDGEFLELREKLCINKREQFFARDAFG